MSIPSVALRHYDVYFLSGTLTFSSLPQITPELNRYVETSSQRHLVLDLSGTELMDSSILRLLVNLKKRLESDHRAFYLLAPNATVERLLRETNLDKAITIVMNPSELPVLVARRFKERHLPYTQDFHGLRKLSLGCPVCGSIHTVGYLIDESDYDWKWAAGSMFPASTTGGTGTVFDVNAAKPIVCTECFFCSLEVEDFNVIDAGGKVALHSSIDDLTKRLLGKSIPKRKKIVQVGVAVSETFFEYPRISLASCCLYQLAETCAQTMAVKKAAESSFRVGYLNYLTLKYAPEEMVAELINNCRTWLSLVVADPSVAFHIHRGQSLFMLMACALKLDRVKEAGGLFAQFEKVMEGAPPMAFAAGPDNPRFWFEQAKKIWLDEISGNGLQRVPR